MTRPLAWWLGVLARAYGARAAVERLYLGWRDGLLRGRGQGGVNARHTYLYRYGSPGHYKYVYPDQAGEEAAEEAAPRRAGSRPRRAGAAPKPAPEPPAAAPPAVPPTYQPHPATNLSRQPLPRWRDAVPEDLRRASIVLWRGVTRQEVHVARRTRVFAGDQRDAIALWGRRAAALQARPDAIALVAVRCNPQRLRPHVPGGTVHQSLFEGPGYVWATAPLSITQVVGVVRRGDPAWPAGVRR